MSEIWEIAEANIFPYTSNQIAYDVDRETILAAIMQKLGRPLDKRRCPICVREAVQFLKREQKKEMAKKKGGATRKKYKLKDIRTGVLGYGITQADCTDDIARQILRLNPAYIAFFLEYPKDWETDIEIKKGAENESNND